MSARVVVVEPSEEGFVDAVFALVEDLCREAQADPRSPRYFFGFASPTIVQSVRAQLIAMHRAAWDEGDDRIRTASGQVLLTGRAPAPRWPLQRAVVVCSGEYPDAQTLAAVQQGDEVILVLDPIRPPAHADVLRRLDAAD
jgi:hypothetical protein